jgi:hypothetical protein
MDLDSQPIDWSAFFNAFSGIKLTIKKNDCEIFLPNYANLIKSADETGTNTTTVPGTGSFTMLADEFTKNSFLVNGQPQDVAFLKHLWNYPTENIKWDDFHEILSFQDVDIQLTTLEEFTKNIDSFLVFHKLEKYGNIFWVGNVTSTFQDQDTNNANVFVKNTYGDATPDGYIEFWSPDKYINDEYKKYASSPATYSGFLTNDDFENGGWFTIPDFRISTKPFDKLKFAEILLKLNFTFDPQPYFGTYYSINSSIGVRIKDDTANLVLDTSREKNSDIDSGFSDVIINNWVGKLLDFDEIDSPNEIGTFAEDPCLTKQQQINNIQIPPIEDSVSHAINPQMSINPDYSSDTRDFLGTIDSINWKSTEDGINDSPHKVGALNIDRAFGGASGNFNAGIVVGGIKTNQNSVAEVIDISEVWNGEQFIRNILLETNTPRCFHNQGGSGNSSCAIVGGFSNMNRSDAKQFTDYGKSGVLGSMEYYVASDNPDLSFFRRISDFSLNIPRGESGGVLEITTDVRKDRFEIEQLVKNYNITPNDEQKIVQFANDTSLDVVNGIPIPSTFRRYNLTNIEGFVYAGNRSGNVYLIDQPLSSDIINSFESIKTTHIDVSQSIISQSITSTESTLSELISQNILDNPLSTVQSVVSVSAQDENGTTVNLGTCGKYRLEYINGAYQLLDSRIGEVIQNVISVNAQTNLPATPVTVSLPYCGKYLLEYLDGDYASSSINQQPSQLDLLGTSSVGRAFVASRCGQYRIDFLNNSSGGAVQVEFDGFFTDDEWRCGVQYSKNGGVTWASPLVNESSLVSASDARSLAMAESRTVCFNTTDNILFRFPSSDSSYVGSVTIEIHYLGAIGGCPTCAITDLYYRINNLSEISLPSMAVNTSHEFCNNYDGSQITLYVKSGSPSNGVGAINTRLTYLGNQDCSCSVATSGDDTFNSISDIYLNEQFVDTAFDSGYRNSALSVELYNTGRPTRRLYDICAKEPNSTLRIKPRDDVDGNFETNGGYTNFRVVYLGVSDCACTDSSESSTAASTLFGGSSEQSVIYSTVDSTKVYPVQCHGLLYVGDKNSGLSTGGRTEYNNISEVECRLKEKYGLIAKNSCTPSTNPLLDNRVLDLVYEYSDFTWIRRQNLFESVYYHTGVGSAEHAIIWGGLHDTLGSYSFDFSIDTVDPETFPISAFDCPDSKTFSQNNISDYGVSYQPLQDLEDSTCWDDPIWQVAPLSGNNLVDDPRFIQTDASLSVAIDDNFPDIYLVSVGPTNPTSLTTQSTSANFDVTSKRSVSVDKTFTTGEAIFQAVGNFINADDTLSSQRIRGNLYVSQIDSLTITDEVNDLYPTTGYIGSTFQFELTDIQVVTTGQVVLYYSLSHTGPSDFTFTGFGRLLISSMQDIWLALKSGNGKIVCDNNVFTVQQSSEIEGSGGDVGFEIQGTCTLTFAVDTTDALAIGVRNSLQQWTTQSSECGVDVSEFIELDIDFKNTRQWGTTLWNGGIVTPIEDFIKIYYSYNQRKENITTTEGSLLYEDTDINIEASSLSSILDGRFLLSGNTTKQEHLFTAIGTVEITGVSGGPGCEDISGSATSSGNTSGEGLSYAEWATSFIQEYRSDERFKLPENFIPSNDSDKSGINTPIAFQNSSWKRFMDGVGLGGEVPDYKSIVDLNNNKKTVSDWSNIGQYFIGQMAFGTPERAIIVGGHRVDPTINKVGIHASETSKRIFLWDFANISPEDSYLTNYLGRRLWTYVIDENNKIIPIQNKSSVSIKMFEGGSKVVVERVGTIHFDGSQTSQQVTFDREMPESVGTNYTISLQPNDNIKVWWDNKSTSGFQVNVETNTWSGDVDYTSSSVITVSPEDFDKLNALDGYIFTEE